MRLRPLLPIASIALVGLAALLIWSYGGRVPGTEPEGLTIAGRVSAEVATPVNGLQVRLRWFEDGVVRGVTVPVQADGTFAAPGLQPGVYSLAVIEAPRDGDAPPRTLAAKDVAVSDRDVRDVQFTIKPGQ